MNRLTIRHLGYATAAVVMMAFPYLAITLFILSLGLKRLFKKRAKTAVSPVPTSLPNEPRAQAPPRLRSQDSGRRLLAVDTLKLRVARQCESSNPHLRVQALDLARHILGIDKRKWAQMTPQQVVAHLRGDELAAA
jgi:hypothetical protein